MGQSNNPLPGTLGVGSNPYLVLDSTAFAIQRAGINNAGNLGETGFHQGSMSFYHGRIDLHALHPGTTNLYFRVGRALITQRDPGDAMVDFGAAGGPITNGSDYNNTTATGGGNPLGTPDAIIIVGGGQMPRMVTVGTGDPNTADSRIDFSMGQQRALRGLNFMGPHSVGILNYPADLDGNADVFFNLLGCDAACMADLANIAGRSMGTILASNVLTGAASDGNPFLPGADLHLILNGGAMGGGLGDDFILTYDFGGGVTVEGIAIPEPSSIVLAILGMAGLAGFGLRRRGSV
jgi:hypothetical protein